MHRIRLGQRFNPFQLAFHLAAAGLGRIDRIGHRLQLLLGSGQHLAEFAELGLHRTEHQPDVAGALLDGQGTEAHLQAVEQGRQGARPGDSDTALALQPIAEAGAAQHFRIQSFGGQEQDREIGGVRRFDVFVADGPRFLPDARLQRLRCRLHAGHIGQFLGRQDAFIVLDRKLGIDRQPDLGLPFTPGQADREFDPLAAVRHGRDVGRVLLGGQHLFEQGGQLHLAPGAAGFHIGQHPLQIADADRQGLHLAQALVHLLQALRHQLERFTQALLQGGMQLFIDRLAHFLELDAVLGFDVLQARFERGADLGQLQVETVTEALQRIRAFLAAGARVLRKTLQTIVEAFLQRHQTALVGISELDQGLREAVDLVVLQHRDARHLLAQRLLEPGHALGQFLPACLPALLDLGAQFTL